jgi:hypothetical protein
MIEVNNIGVWCEYRGHFPFAISFFSYGYSSPCLNYSNSLSSGGRGCDDPTSTELA